MSTYGLESPDTGQLYVLADPAVHVCGMHEDHGSAQVIRLELHHVFPQYLQRRVWGEALNNTKDPLCPNGHDTLHFFIERMVSAIDHDAGPATYFHQSAVADACFDRGARRKYSKEWQLGRKGVDMWLSAVATARLARAAGPRSAHPREWRCSLCGGGNIQTPIGWTHTCDKD